MTDVVMLADFDAQHINGGWGSKFSFSSTSFKAVSTTLGQSNSSSNLGLGVLLGAGIATSEQVNLASITTLVA